MISTSAGTKVSIGTSTRKTDATTYAADTWTVIDNITDAGEFGSEAEIVVVKMVNQTYTKKLKGSRDNGTVEFIVARDSSDAGYQALVAAEQTGFAFNFKFELADKPASGASPKNSIMYFAAIVASRKNSLKGADDVVTTTFSLAISGEILEVAASAT